MAKLLWLLVVVCMRSNYLTAQRPIPIKTKTADSVQRSEIKDDAVFEMPVISLNENDRSDHGTAFVPSLLYANRDVFLNLASFHFATARFKMRGYDADLFSTSVNGMHMNNPDDGNTQWSLWSGLNDVTRNNQLTLALRPGEQSFGNVGNMIAMDMRASKQKTQTQFSYSFANRSYAHRWALTRSTPMNRSGWAFSGSVTWRIAEKGYMPGTDYKSLSYYFAVDKRINTRQLFSLLFFGNHTTNARQGPVLRESVDLSNESFYNPYWGIQSGKIRNANVACAHQPVLILTDEHRINNHTTWVITMGLVAGKKSGTALDWYNAPDPRPDYYRYLPSYQRDTALYNSVVQTIMQNRNSLQINWDHLYEVNRNSFETLQNANGAVGENYSGLRAHYLLEERIADMVRYDIATTFNTKMNDLISLAGGCSYQTQQTRYYKKIADLLGASYAVDWNQFAENDFPDNNAAIQNDLNRPDRVLHKGDVYGYDYAIRTTKVEGWAQLIMSMKKVDAFAAMSASYTNFLRDGYMRNGLFPDESFGRSGINEFQNVAFKTGITCKLSGRRYLYANVLALSRPPLFDNVYISPRTRDTRQAVIQSERLKSAELGFVTNAPRLRMRATMYVTLFQRGMNVIGFYHDGYRSFVNYALSGIDKIHHGLELGAECKITRRFTLNAAASVGRYYYNSRPSVSVSADNDAYVLEQSIIYQKNYRVGGTPQEAYGLGISWQPANGAAYMNLTASFFGEQWLDINPLRRTYESMENVSVGSQQWQQILAQEKLPVRSTLDFSGGTTFRTRLFSAKHKKAIALNLSVNNLLNKKDFISGGYEQLRFDVETKNTGKFPPKYFYAMGLNFSVNCSLKI